MDRHHFFVFYSSKATYVLNHRNTFVSVYLTSLMLIFIPLLLSTNVDCSSSLVQFLQNGAFAYLMMLIITAIPVLAWFFWESKYKEYRWNYMEVAIRCICEEKIFNKPNPPKNYDDLCKILEDYTLFGKENIMPILRYMQIPEHLHENVSSTPQDETNRSV